jgi:FAD:protein FMN transferase
VAPNANDRMESVRHQTKDDQLSQSITMKKQATFLLANFCIYLFTLSAAAKTARPHVFHHENVLGTSLAIKVISTSPAAAEKAEAAALAEIARNAQLLSTYNPQSEVSQWLQTAHTPTRISSELFAVLQLFDQWRGRTNGALDASADVVSRLWKVTAKENRVPSKAEITAAVAAMQQTHWQLNATAQTATHLSNAPLVLNSFVKSYIINRATEAAMAAANVKAVVVNIGGDLLVRGTLTETVDIADPLSDAENSDAIAHLLIRDRAVATSGNYRRGIQIGDRWYSHIVDPRTGLPADHVISATVVAPSATDAGALATAFSVLTPEDSLRLAASLPNVECLLITKDGQRLTSAGWNALEAPRKAAPAAVTVAPTVQSWDASMELVVSFELANINAGGYRRPYVAVWVEDATRFPVRTLALWYQKPRWLPDLKAWSRADRLRSMAEGTDLTRSVSSATRSAGKYTLKWDGKDNQGKPVKPGRYTVFIEAAREHGTYQLMRQELDFRGTPQQASLPGNTEIASASLNYRKK